MATWHHSARDDLLHSAIKFTGPTGDSNLSAWADTPDLLRRNNPRLCSSSAASTASPASSASASAPTTTTAATTSTTTAATSAATTASTTVSTWAANDFFGHMLHTSAEQPDALPDRFEFLERDAGMHQLRSRTICTATRTTTATNRPASSTLKSCPYAGRHSSYSEKLFRLRRKQRGRF